MICIHCNKNLPENSVFCCFCGKKQTVTTRKNKKRGNGQGTIFKRGNGYAVEITLGYVWENGKLKRRARRKCGFPTKKAAAAYLETLRNEPAKAPTATISELWERFLSTAELSKSKLQSYQTAYKRIKSRCEFRTLETFTVAELQEITDDVATTYSTKRDVKILFSHLYKIALENDLIDKNRAQYIKLPPEQRSERLVLSDEEISALWDDFKKTQNPISAAALIMIYTGMRPGEINAVKPDNVHFDEHYLTGGIKTEKGRNRKIIIPDKIAPVLRALLANNSFMNSVDRKYLQHNWRKTRDALGIRPEITLHCCRHTFVTRMTELNVSPAMLQELVGHTDYETTLNYTHLSVADRLNAVNKL